MIRILLSITIAAVIIAGCSSTTTSPTGSNSYVVSTTGSYFIKSNVSLEKDSATGAINESEAYEDSTVVTGKSTMADSKGVSKSAIVMVTFVDGEPTDTTYMAEEGNKVYLLMDMSTGGGLGVDVDLGSRWTLVADQSASGEWTAVQDSVSNIEIDYDGTKLMANIGVSVKCKKNGTENLTVSGKVIETIKYAMTYNFTMYINVGIAVVPLPITLTSEIWMGKGVGLVKQLTQPTTVSVPMLGFSFDIPGSRSAVVRYSVKAS
jgi:hypothetical protein